MKNVIKVFGMSVLAALIVFAMLACDNPAGGGDDGGDGGSNSGPVAFGDTLKLSGQVYTEEYAGPTPSYKKYTGILAITDYGAGGTGAVANGILTYTVGVPNSLQPIQDVMDNNFDEDYYTNLSASISDAQGYAFNLFSTTPDGWLYKSNYSLKISGNSFSENSDDVMYFYVDKDVTISGKGSTDSGGSYSDTYSDTYKDFSLALKKGWNAVRTQYSVKGTFTGTIDNPTGSNTTGTETISLGNPDSARWVFEAD